MQLRKLGKHTVPEIGLGCMNLSHAYGGKPDEEYAIKLIHRAFELGVRHFDTAALYGFGRNETLLGKALKPFRSEIHLASKCVMTGVDGKRVIDGRPESLMQTIDGALQRLQVEQIDLYYLHRWDKNVPIEESMGAMARMVEQGKIAEVGLSEVSAETLRKAHTVHPVAAVQTEYSLWTRNAEIAVIEACKELGAAFVAFSPLARGFLSGVIQREDQYEKGDIRAAMPRFQEPSLSENLKLYAKFESLAKDAQCSPSQLAIAWVLAQGEHIIPIPGTKNIEHLEEDMQTASLNIDAAILSAAGDLINQKTVTGHRYPAGTLIEIDTEDFD